MAEKKLSGNLAGNSAGILPFVIDAGVGRKAAIRGRLARMDHVVDTILGRHNYPQVMGKLAAESVVLASCLASTMSYDGIFTLQAKGEGAIKTLLADVTTDGAVRAYMGYDEHQDIDADDGGMGAPAPMMQLMGTGHLAFTVDQGADMERYQGIVPLEGATLAEAALGYFTQSEQIETSLRLAAAPILLAGGKSEWRAGGIILQQGAMGILRLKLLKMMDVT